MTEQDKQNKLKDIVEMFKKAKKNVDARRQMKLKEAAEKLKERRKLHRKHDASSKMV